MSALNTLIYARTTGRTAPAKLTLTREDYLKLRIGSLWHLPLANKYKNKIIDTDGPVKTLANTGTPTSPQVIAMIRKLLETPVNILTTGVERNKNSFLTASRAYVLLRTLYSKARKFEVATVYKLVHDYSLYEMPSGLTDANTASEALHMLLALSRVLSIDDTKDTAVRFSLMNLCRDNDYLIPYSNNGNYVDLKPNALYTHKEAFTYAAIRASVGLFNEADAKLLISMLKLDAEYSTSKERESILNIRLCVNALEHVATCARKGTARIYGAMPYIQSWVKRNACVIGSKDLITKSHIVTIVTGTDTPLPTLARLTTCMANEYISNRLHGIRKVTPPWIAENVSRFSTRLDYLEIINRTCPNILK